MSKWIINILTQNIVSQIIVSQIIVTLINEKGLDLYIRKLVKQNYKKTIFIMVRSIFNAS